MLASVKGQDALNESGNPKRESAQQELPRHPAYVNDGWRALDGIMPP
jgi:hypothetical protein